MTQSTPHRTSSRRSGVAGSRWLLLACATALTYSVHAQGGSYRVFVTNEASGDLTVIDGSNQQAIANWRLGKRPRGIVAAPDGQHLCVAVSGSPLGGPGVDEKSLPPPDKSADGIDVVNVMTGKVERVLTGVSDPEQLAVSADGTRLYVASEDSSSLVVIRASDGKVLKRAAAGGEPEGVAVSASAKLVGVTSETSNMVTLMDSAHFQIVGRVPVGLRPRDIAFSADGGTAYVSGENDASLTVIDVMSRKTVRTVHFSEAGARPKGIAVSDADARIYVTTGRGGHVDMLFAKDLTVSASIAVGARPWGIALSPDGRYAYTANGPSNDVSVVDTHDPHVTQTIKAGKGPWGVATLATTQ